MNWEKVKLEDICQITGGTTPKTNRPEFWDGNIVWLSPVDLPEVGSITNVYSSQRMITSEGLASCSLRLLPVESLVFSTRASIGKIGIVKTPLATNQGFTNFIPGERVNVRYLAYVLKKSIPAIEKLGNSTTFNEVSRTAIKNFEIPLPPLPIQQQMADTLDKADALRRKDLELLDKYDELAQAVFYEMFGDPVRNEKGWDLTELGKATESFKYGTNTKCDIQHVTGAVPVVRIPNVLDDVVSFKDLKYGMLSERDWHESKLEKGDLLFVRTNGNPNYIGRCAVFNSEMDVAYASYLIRARFSTTGKLLPQFVQSVISYKSYRKEILKHATTTAGNYNINTQSLKSLKIITPKISTQIDYINLYTKIKELSTKTELTFHKSQQLFNIELNNFFIND